MYQIFFNKERKKNIKRKKNLVGESPVEWPIYLEISIFSKYVYIYGPCKQRCVFIKNAEQLHTPLRIIWNKYSRALTAWINNRGASKITNTKFSLLSASISKVSLTVSYVFFFRRILKLKNYFVTRKSSVLKHGFLNNKFFYFFSAFERLFYKVIYIFW